MNHLGQKKSGGVKCSHEVKAFNLLMQTFCHTSEKQYAQVYSYMTPEKAMGANFLPILILRQEEFTATHRDQQHMRENKNRI